MSLFSLAEQLGVQMGVQVAPECSRDLFHESLDVVGVELGEGPDEDGDEHGHARND